MHVHQTKKSSKELIIKAHEIISDLILIKIFLENSIIVLILSEKNEFYPTLLTKIFYSRKKTNSNI